MLTGVDWFYAHIFFPQTTYPGCGTVQVAGVQSLKARSTRIECRPLTLSDQAGIAQLVEHNLAKVGVASSNLVSRSKISQ